MKFRILMGSYAKDGVIYEAKKNDIIETPTDLERDFNFPNQKRFERIIESVPEEPVVVERKTEPEKKPSKRRRK